MPVAGTTLTSLRPLIQGTNGVVVSSHPSAAMIGLDILQRGGNAIDAGVAVGLALNVVHAHECNSGASHRRSCTWPAAGRRSPSMAWECSRRRCRWSTCSAIIKGSCQQASCVP